MEPEIKKIALAAILIGGFIGGMFLLKTLSRGGSPTTRWTIGILQTASHPALDEVRKGFVELVQEKMGSEVSFIIRNGEGSSSQLHMLAQQFHTKPEIAAIFAIATPAVQAMASVEQEKPLIIAAVTDPQQLGILTPTTNVCGTSDMINVEQEVQSMKLLVPTVKTVAILYSPSEINATIVAEKMEKVLSKEGLTPRLVRLTSHSEVVSAVSAALSKADALIAPTDNLLASAITVIAAMARKAGKPLIVSDNTLVKYGALMAQGVNYYENGKESGRIAYEVLAEKKKPYELPIRYSSSEKMVINKQILKELGLTVPQALLPQVEFVETVVGE